MNPETFGVTADLARWTFGPLDGKGALSILILVGAALFRWGVIALVRARSDVLSDRQRWWINAAKNLSGLIAFVGLVALWRAEIGEAALSLAAVAVALVIATKELLLCVTGALWRQFAQPFAFGDWVEIGDFNGEVVEETLLATQLQEIDRDDFSLTGRVVSVPNALLLSQPVINNSFRKRFVYLNFDMAAQPGVDVDAVLAATRRGLAEATADFAETARRYAARIEKAAGVRLPDPEPRLAVRTTELANVVVRATVFCPRERAAGVRDTAVRAFLAAARAGAAAP